MESRTKSGQKILYYSERLELHYIDRRGRVRRLPTNADVKRFKAEYNPIEIDLRKENDYGNR